jgi:hypothetical protein
MKISAYFPSYFLVDLVLYLFEGPLDAVGIKQVDGFDRYYLRMVRMTAECKSQWRRDCLENTGGYGNTSKGMGGL